ncbi:MAG: hypothetical protein WDM86_06190 [Rhizomicrobium sp.]
MTPVPQSAVPSGLPSLFGTLALMIVPPLALGFAAPSAGPCLAIGAASWAVAVAVKFGLMRLSGVRRRVEAGIAGAAAWGLFSAVDELGLLAAAVLWSGVRPDASGIVAFGIGASSSEIAFVLASGIAERLRGLDPQVLEAWLAGARLSPWVRHMLFIERLGATLGHVGSRGLVYLAIAGGPAWAAAPAIAAFALVDGVAIRGRSRKWNWFDPATARRFYAMTLATGAAELAAFAALATLVSPA